MMRARSPRHNRLRFESGVRHRRHARYTRTIRVKTTAEVVIVGAGIMGCAIAHALAERGVADVVVLERDQIGRGATADAAGGVRQQFSTETNIRLAQESVRVWERSEEHTS